MQVFVPFPEPFHTASVLDGKRLNKQIIECRQILSAIKGESKGWRNHPVTRMYSGWTVYLEAYLEVLAAYKEGNRFMAERISRSIRKHDYPTFFCREYLDNMKSRLYTKDKEHYRCFAKYGESYTNMYFVDGEWKCFQQKASGERSGNITSRNEKIFKHLY